MNKVLLLVMAIFMVACSSKKYPHTDYAYGCVTSKNNPDISANVTDVCLPMDTYIDTLHFHKTRPSERRYMPNLDDAMDRQ